MSLDCWAECWTSTAGSKPASEVGHADFSESYEVDTMHVFQLQNGQWAVVRECGCSCYESSEADIELFPSYGKAVIKYIEYRKENGGTFTNLEYLEMKSLEKENEPLSKNSNPETLP